jgi:hypothetical protein
VPASLIIRIMNCCMSCRMPTLHSLKEQKLSAKW